MSYFTADKIGTALAKARVEAGLSQREMAHLIGMTERTVQNWEKGQSSPDSDEIMDWFTACGASPLAAMQEMLHPELYRKQATDMTDEELDAAIASFLDNSPPHRQRDDPLHRAGQAWQLSPGGDRRNLRQSPHPAAK